MSDSFRIASSDLATPASSDPATPARPKWCPRPATEEQIEEQRHTILSRNPAALALRDQLDSEEIAKMAETRQRVMGFIQQVPSTAPHGLLCLRAHCEDFLANLELYSIKQCQQHFDPFGNLGDPVV